MKLRDLAKRLAAKPNQNAEVEFIVLTKDKGQIISMEIERQATDIVKALRLFKGGDGG